MCLHVNLLYGTFHWPDHGEVNDPHCDLVEQGEEKAAVTRFDGLNISIEIDKVAIEIEYVYSWLKGLSFESIYNTDDGAALR